MRGHVSRVAIGLGMVLGPLLLCGGIPWTPPLAGARDAPDVVRARIATFYLESDVAHTFESAMGDVVDCTDVAAEPGVQALLARGLSMAEIMAPIQAGQAPGAPVGIAYFGGDLDESGSVRSCPAATVPHVRVDPATAVDGDGDGLTSYLEQIVKRSPPSAPPPPEAATVGDAPASGGLQQMTGPYAWVVDTFSPGATLSAIQGGTSTMTITAPWLARTSGGHSIAQVWLSGGDHAVGGLKQTVEAGWLATPGSQSGPQPARLFVFTTPDDYATACYGGGDGSPCVPWVPNPDATLALGASLPASTPGGQQHELQIRVEHQCGGGSAGDAGQACTGWGIWASVDGATPPTYLGYYANVGYDGDGIGGLGLGGDDFEAGSEVLVGSGSPTPAAVALGEDPLPCGRGAFGLAAYHRDFAYFASASTLVATGSTVYETCPDYVYDLAGAAGSPTWTNYFYYGDLAACGCVPATTCPAEDTCGSASDGCGGQVSCGTCSDGSACSDNRCVEASDAGKRSGDPGDSTGGGGCAVSRGEGASEGFVWLGTAGLLGLARVDRRRRAEVRRRRPRRRR